MKKIIVVGGGAAGMMAAVTAARSGKQVVLIEKNEKLGKKLYITGKGRCNVTNNSEPDELIASISGNREFLYSAFYSFTSRDTMDFFEALGVPLNVERGGRVFPASDKASDITRALEKALRAENVDICLNTPVKGLDIENNKINGIITSQGKYPADSIIIATGGLSYPATGSTGDGYKFARASGHTVTKLMPSLVPLKVEEEWVNRLMGLSLKNISITLRDGKSTLHTDFGELMFTHFGLSGPVILSASRHVSGKPLTLSIDLKPALTEKELDQRLLRDFEKNINRDFKNSLDELLPQKMIPVIIELSGINPDKKIHDITKAERKNFVSILKQLNVTITGTTGYNEAVVTRGGVSVNEIDPGTMESKLVPGLYFAGEVIDVDGPTGGYNLQIAFSTGYLAGINA